MASALERATDCFETARTVEDQVIGARDGWTVRFGIDADDRNNEPAAVWALHVLLDSGALDLLAAAGSKRRAVPTGDEMFDVQIAITTNQPAVVPQLFDETTRAKVLDLGVRIDCRYGDLRVMKYASKTVESKVPVEAMTDLGISLASRVQDLVRSGVIPDQDASGGLGMRKRPSAKLVMQIVVVGVLAVGAVVLSIILGR